MIIPSFFKRWAPSIIMMAVIFSFSSIPSGEMPRFGTLDFTIKKLGHTIGYALLAIANSHGLQIMDKYGDGRTASSWAGHPKSIHSARNLSLVIFAWLMTILYSTADEYHQSFVPGRNPSLWDVFIFDNGGAILGLWLYAWIKTRRKI